MPIPSLDRSWSALFQPGAATVYGFDHIGAGPIGESATDPRRVALACEFARLAYQPDAALRARALADALPLHLEEVALLEKSSTACHVAISKTLDLTIVAFRGTDEARDWATNLHAVTSSWKPGGRAHRGFKQAWYSLAPELRDRLRPLPPRRLLCGHSLGGALALLEASAHGCEALYTFGSPRPGTDALVTTVKAPHFRVVNHHDPVPELPLGGPPFFFTHGGTAIHLGANGDPTRDAPSLRERLGVAVALARSSSAWRDLGHHAPPFLADHAPVNYAAKLVAALPA